MTLDDLLQELDRLALVDQWPKPLPLFDAVRAIRAGVSLAEAAKRIGTSPAHLRRVAAADSVLDLAGC